MDFYFENIRIIEPSSGTDETANVRIKDGYITDISKQELETNSDTQRIDGRELIMAPGFIDIHVHLREPGQEQKETIKSGTDSAANGGFTSVVCMPNTTPAIDSKETIEYIKNKSEGLLTNVLISAAITKGRKGLEIGNLDELHDLGVVLFTDDGSPVSDSDVMRDAFFASAKNDLLLSQHCEDTKLTGNFLMNESPLSNKLGLKGYPRIAEEIILFRDITMAEYYGNRAYHAQHLSTAGAIDIVRYAKSRSIRATCEATPHHFVLTEENMAEFNPNFKMNPPLRQSHDVEAIIEGIKDGTIDCIATDHAPHTDNEKGNGLEMAPNGIIGLETAIGLSMTYLVHKKHISINRMIEMLTVNPRRVLRLDNPEIKAGAMAELTIFAPDEVWTVNKNKFKSKSKNTPFDGFVLKGKPKYVFNNFQYLECNL
ncbi:MAG: dihydroorotase [Candidatus Kapaibacterium sp.]